MFNLKKIEQHYDNNSFTTNFIISFKILLTVKDMIFEINTQSHQANNLHRIFFFMFVSVQNNEHKSIFWLHLKSFWTFWEKQI